jgi:hypothetical protein
MTTLAHNQDLRSSPGGTGVQGASIGERLPEVTGSSLFLVIVAAAFISAVVAVSAALITISVTGPSDRELQRAAADELGIPGFLLDVPGAQALADDVTDRVTHRVIDESRPSIATGLTIGGLTGAASAVISAIALLGLCRQREESAAALQQRE